MIRIPRKKFSDAQLVLLRDCGLYVNERKFAFTDDGHIEFAEDDLELFIYYANVSREALLIDADLDSARDSRSWGAIERKLKALVPS